MGDKKVFIIGSVIGIAALALVIGVAIGSARARIGGDTYNPMRLPTNMHAPAMQQDSLAGVPRHIHAGTQRYLQSRNLNQQIQNGMDINIQPTMMQTVQNTRPMMNPMQQRQLMLQNLQAQQILMQNAQGMRMPNQQMMMPNQPPQMMMPPMRTMTTIPGATLIREFGAEVTPIGPGRVKIVGVMGNSWAAKAGLKRGDIILRFNKQKVVGGPKQLQSMVRQVRNEMVYPIIIMRDGQIKKLNIKVGEGEMDNFRPIMPNARKKKAAPPQAFMNPAANTQGMR